MSMASASSTRRIARTMVGGPAAPARYDRHQPTGRSVPQGGNAPPGAHVGRGGMTVPRIRETLWRVNVLARQPDRTPAAVLGGRLVLPRFLREPFVIGTALLLYLAVRLVTEGSRAAAFQNARRIVDLETLLGIRWEHGFQQLVLAHEWLLDLANWIYVWGHWPVLA